MSYRPRIAIPLRKNVDAPDEYLAADYAGAIHAAGGAPFLVPLIPDPESVCQLLKNAEGVCLSGSNSDVAPELYGAKRLPALGPVQPLRDRTDELLLAEAFAQRLPVLAICYGMQRLNVFYGGDLIQDLAAEGLGRIDHRVFPGEGHPVEVDGDVIPATMETLRQRVRAEAAAASRAHGLFQVNTSHHQAVRTAGRGLTPFAWAPDGVVEGLVQTEADSFVLAVQWHPERSPGCPLAQAIFTDFIQACADVIPW